MTTEDLTLEKEKMDTIFGKTANQDVEIETDLKITLKERKISGGNKYVRRVYFNQNVYEAARHRIKMVFDKFDKIVISFSSGKDSGVVLNMAIDECRKRRARGEDKKIIVMFLDLEAYCHFNQDFVERMFTNNSDVIIPFWICLPMESDSALSFTDPIWKWWDPEKEAVWVRPMPTHPAVVNLKNHKFDFYTDYIKKNGRYMTFEDFIDYIPKWIGTHNVETGELENKTSSVASLVGIRTTESLNRFRALILSNKKRWEPTDKEKYISEVMEEYGCDHATASTFLGFTESGGVIWSTSTDVGYQLYIIYDWTVADIWVYNAGAGTRNGIPNLIRNSVKRLRMLMDQYPDGDYGEDAQLVEDLKSDIEKFFAQRKK